MGLFRIVRKDGCVPPAYVIQESVTPDGKYIEWPDLHGSVESAKTFLTKSGFKGKVQVAVRWDDPEFSKKR